MNKRLYIPSIILLVAMLVSGCSFQVVGGSGKLSSETRNVSGFTGVSLAGIGSVYITQGPTESVRIEAEDNLIPYFDTSVVGSTLKIGLKEQYMGISMQPTRPVKFYVTLPRIEAVTLAGSGDIFAEKIQADAFSVFLLGSGNISTNALTAKNLNIQLSGSGNINLGTVTASQVTATITGSGNLQVEALAADKISSKTAGSGNITIGGKVTDQSAEILGSGDYMASGLKSATATVRVTGSGSSQVTTSRTLNVTILGSGDVAYSGSPTVNASIAGSGKVRPVSQ
jgi:Putative auto-transporter adhesin, head GIN domain